MATVATPPPAPDLSSHLGQPVADAIAELRGEGMNVQTRYAAFSGPLALLASLIPPPQGAKTLTVLVTGGKVVGFADEQAPASVLAAVAAAVLRFAGSGPDAGAGSA